MKPYIYNYLYSNLKYVNNYLQTQTTVKILKFGTPQTNAIIVLKIEKFAVTLY